jgi:RecB family exonuclease
MSGASSAYDPAEVLSPSSCATFCSCPAKWAFRKVYRLPDPPTGARTLGSAVHSAIAENFNQKLETRRDLPAAGVITLFRLAWDLLVRGAYPARRGRTELATEFRDEENPAEMKQQGETLVRLYMDQVAPHIEPAAVELPVSGRIGGVSVRGVIDLLDVHGRVIDLKTAARKPSEISPDYRMQVASYALLAPRANGTARLDTITKTKKPAVHSAEFAVDQPDIDQAVRTYPAVQQAMRAGVFFPNRGHFACSRSHCSYWRNCEHTFGGRVPE